MFDCRDYEVKLEKEITEYCIDCDVKTLKQLGYDNDNGKKVKFCTKCGKTYFAKQA